MTKITNIAIVNLESVFSSAIIGMIDIFNLANHNDSKQPKKQFHITVVRSGKIKSVYDDAPITIHDQQISDTDQYDVVIIPPIISTNPSSDTELFNWLREMHQKGAILCSACVGAYILASAGLLKHKRITTHWLIEQKMRHYFPSIIIDIEKVVIDENQIITSGGVSAYIDLTLYLIEKFKSVDVARHCAILLSVDPNRESQLHHKNLTHMNLDDSYGLNTTLEWIETHFFETITITDMVEQSGWNKRTFLRKFKEATHMLPSQYLQYRRIEKAKELLINTDLSFEKVTNEVGYENAPSFRKLFKKNTGLNPGEYRQRFQR